MGLLALEVRDLYTRPSLMLINEIILKQILKVEYYGGICSIIIMLDIWQGTIYTGFNDLRKKSAKAVARDTMNNGSEIPGNSF